MKRYCSMQIATKLLCGNCSGCLVGSMGCVQICLVENILILYESNVFYHKIKMRPILRLPEGLCQLNPAQKDGPAWFARWPRGRSQRRAGDPHWLGGSHFHYQSIQSLQGPLHHRTGPPRDHLRSVHIELCACQDTLTISPGIGVDGCSACTEDKWGEENREGKKEN